MPACRLAAAALAANLVLAPACTSQGEAGGNIPATQSAFVVVVWNDLGMHCLNPTYDTLVILPPYNTLWAQVIRRGSPPAVVTGGVTVEYRIVDNTSSYGKRSYGQFWDFAQVTFGAAPARDHGLDLAGPESFGLSGAMVVRGGDHFEADGVPLVPVDDGGTWNPYQVAEITVKDGAGAVLAQTRATVPTSDEISCDRCHLTGVPGVPAVDMGPTGDTFRNVLWKHDQKLGTALLGAATGGTPVLCAGCHASPALRIMAPSHGATTYVSEAIHGFHGALPPAEQPACYDCHPGPTTQCSRSLAHVMGQADGNCTHCHGTLATVGGSIATGGRVPWIAEPACATCHPGVAEVDTSALATAQHPEAALYRNAPGHGGVRCAGCHGSPHAMAPSRVGSDDAQMIQYQGKAAPLGDCLACHDSSRGGGTLSEFPHAGAGARPNACFVCHTSITADTARWPHAFQWKDRRF